MNIQKLNKYYDPFSVYSLFKDHEDSVFLDSSKEDSDMSRYSFIAVNPITKIVKTEKEVLVDGIKKSVNFFSELNKIINKYKLDYNSEIPFISGMIGYISYDFSLGEGMKYSKYSSTFKIKKDEIVAVPEAVFALYENIIIFDLINKNTYISSLGVLKNQKVSIKEIIENNYSLISEKSISDNSVKFKSDFNKKEYIDALDKLINYIKDGHIYVTNMTRRVECDILSDSFDVYESLRKINKAPFSAYMNYKDFQIISSSPERFLNIVNRKVVTRPIKGTRPRGKSVVEDLKLRTELENSEKDKSELLMIVDLERNDLSKVCKINTVKVPELFKIEEYSTVFHLVSTVEGILKDNISSVDCIKECFPGGSITGAPKLRSMEIINELEKSRRGIYTGIIGYFDLRGNADFNIIIRTILKKDNKAVFGIGGGITYESKKEEEWIETIDKGKALIKALGKTHIRGEVQNEGNSI